MSSHTDERERSNPAEPLELTDPEGVEREITAFVGGTIDETAVDGIDSTVSATLAVCALHRQNVYGLLLPADSTREGNLEGARAVAEDLVIDYRLVDGGHPVDETAAALDPDSSLVARYADVVDRSDHERMPPPTPTDRSSLRPGGGR